MRPFLRLSAAAVLMLAHLTACTAERVDPRRDTEESTESFELLINEPAASARPQDTCNVEICTRLLTLIEAAERTIDFAVYGARNQTRILNALLAAQRRGVRVRGMVDRDRHGASYYTSTDEWISRLGTDAVSDDMARESSSEGIFEPLCGRPDGFHGPLQCLAYDLGHAWLTAEHASRDDFTDPALGGVNKIMHHKFFVVDRRYVWTGSANISDSGTGGYNANAVVVADSRPLASVFTAEFEHLLARNRPTDRKPRDGVEIFSVGGAEVTTWFSPQDDSMRFGVQALIAKSRRTIDVAVFFLTNKWAVADLIGAHQRGVRVRVIVDATSAKNGYSKHELLRQAGISVKVENWGGKMHMKAAVVDGEFLVLGSMNWTSAGEDTNDENTLLVRSRPLAARMETSFEQMWRSIPDRWARKDARPDPESRVSGAACADGIDNDFDDLIDDRDPGCSDDVPLPSLPPHRLVPKDSTGDAKPPRGYRLYLPLACDTSYPNWWVCLPQRPGGKGPDFDCHELPYRSIAVLRPDPHRLDGNGDGVGCEPKPPSTRN